MKKNSSFDYLIVGAGPAGLFAAYELVCRQPRAKIAIVEKGELIEKREKTEIMCGVGGTGTYSDGKLHYTPILSHEKMFHFYSPAEYQIFLDEVDKILTSFGVHTPYYPKNQKGAQSLVEECHRQGIELFTRRIQHVGSDILPQIILNFQNFLIKKDVKFFTGREAAGLIAKNNQCLGIIDQKGQKMLSRHTLLAPGRYGAIWLRNLCEKLKIKYIFDKIEIGIRVEFPAAIMRHFSDKMYEAIFMVHPPTFDDAVRTFCPCPHGYVAREDYAGFVSVNGHSNSENQAANSNFALVAEINLTHPVENTTDYALSIAKLATTIGGGKPILQRLADFQNGRRSTWERIKKSYVIPSLTDVTPGDISMALPHRIAVNIQEAIQILDQVMPGLNNGSTLLYAPEIKLRASKIETAKNLETKIKKLFVAGDGAGLSGCITGAAVTGLLAARGMLKHQK